METTQQLIIGGGLAGLHTALRLEEAGKPYLLLEGRPRLGGRIATADADLTLDMGPTWFGPHQQRMQALLAELGLSWFEQYTRGDVLYETAPGQAPTRHPGAGQATSFRLTGGLTSLVQALHGGLPRKALRLDHEVTLIERGDDQWRVRAIHDGQDTHFTAQHLIAALPPRQLLKAMGRASWASDALRNELAAQQTWMSAQAKFVAVYERAFWREAGLAGDAFSRVGPMVEIHDASDESASKPALFGFIGVPANTRRSIKAGELEAACIAQLARLFGDQARQPQLAALTDWAAEPLTATSRDLEEMSAHAHFSADPLQQELAQLGLYLAGSEFAVGEPGYLEGALEASAQVLESLFANAA